MFKSSASEASESVRLMYLLSIASAAESVRIANAYFVPDDAGRRDARRRAAPRRAGRDHRAGPSHRRRSRAAGSRSRWGPLLEAGVEIYEYQPTMYHSKVMIVDGLWTSVGSTNFDNRSFRLNDEANLNVLDEEFAATGAAVRGGQAAIEAADTRSGGGTGHGLSG